MDIDKCSLRSILYLKMFRVIYLLPPILFRAHCLIPGTILFFCMISHEITVVLVQHHSLGSTRDPGNGR
jgi:hypothetical protein